MTMKKKKINHKQDVSIQALTSFGATMIDGYVDVEAIKIKK